MNEILDFLNQDFWGATPGDYLAFLAIASGTLLLKRTFSRLVARLTARFAIRMSDGKYSKLFRSLIRKPLEWLFAVILLFYAFSFIEAPLSKIVLLHWKRKSGIEELSLIDIVGHLFALFAIIFTTLLISRLVDFFFRAKAEKAHHSMEKARAQLLPLLKDVLKIVLWTIGFFWLLGAVFQVNIPALITGLGIGGVALALAAKESIENLLASFTILADKPFVADDTVRLGSLEGKVERIGFRSTRLRSADGSLLIVPNKKLIDESLENLSERDVRKMRLSIPLKKGLPETELKGLMAAIRDAIEACTHVKSGTNVSIDSFGENTIQLSIIYHLPDDLPEEEIQISKSEVAMLVYGIIESSRPKTTPPPDENH